MKTIRNLLLSAAAVLLTLPVSGQVVSHSRAQSTVSISQDDAEMLSGFWETHDPFASKLAQLGILLNVEPGEPGRLKVRVYERLAGNEKGGWFNTDNGGGASWDGHRLRIERNGKSTDVFPDQMAIDLTFNGQKRLWTGTYTRRGTTKAVVLSRPAGLLKPASNPFLGRWHENDTNRCVYIVQGSDGKLLAWRTTMSPSAVSFHEYGDALGVEIESNTVTLREGIAEADSTGNMPEKFVGKLSADGSQIVGHWQGSVRRAELGTGEATTFTRPVGPSCWSQSSNTKERVLLSRFQSEQDVAAKEAIMLKITTNYPDAGPALLNIARETKSMDTRWLAIRGIGDVKFRAAVPFLLQSLDSQSSYVRANSARALGEIGDPSAIRSLIRMLKNEQDSGVIEQTALAFEMLGAKEALPALKAKAENPSSQTRDWVLGAVEVLGSKRDIPFFAAFLFDNNYNVALDAAAALERLTGQDFGLPKCSGNGPCGVDYEGIKNAQRWWKAHKENWSLVTPMPSPTAGACPAATDVVVTRPEEPIAPPGLSELGGSISVTILVTVNPDGSVKSAQVERSSNSLAVDKAALNAARSSTYRPKIVNCHPVEGTYHFTVKFEPN